MEPEETIKHRDKRLPHGSPVDICDTFELTEKEFEKLSITDKFSAMWKKKYVDLSLFNHSHYAGWVLFLYVSISGLYVMRNYVVASMDRGAYCIYWHKVGVCYLWYISTAHWLCVLLYESFWAPDVRDHIELAHKTLWDDYDATLKAIKKVRTFDTLDGESSSRRRMLNYAADEQTGLRWRYCLVCRHDSPPRSHHCVICNKCILKRDHHCYMTGRCIGYWNQRYFFFLCFFCMLSCFLFLAAEGYYLFHNAMESINNEWKTLFIPLAIYKWLWLGEISLPVVIIISHFYLYPLIGCMCFSFVALQSIMIIRGITAEEMKRGIKIQVNLSVSERWRDVFGEWWILNFVMPSQLLFKQSGDGEHWSGLINLDSLAVLKDLRVRR